MVGRKKWFQSLVAQSNSIKGFDGLSVRRSVTHFAKTGKIGRIQVNSNKFNKIRDLRNFWLSWPCSLNVKKLGFVQGLM